jgi:hypothetical protein
VENRLGFVVIGANCGRIQLVVAFKTVRLIVVIGIVDIVVVDESTAFGAGGVVVFVAIAAEGVGGVVDELVIPASFETAVAMGCVGFVAALTHEVAVEFAGVCVGENGVAVAADLFGHGGFPPE